jgi:hypothetical protein
MAQSRMTSFDSIRIFCFQLHHARSMISAGQSLRSQRDPQIPLHIDILMMPDHDFPYHQSHRSEPPPTHSPSCGRAGAGALGSVHVWDRQNLPTGRFHQVHARQEGRPVVSARAWPNETIRVGAFTVWVNAARSARGADLVNRYLYGVASVAKRLMISPGMQQSLITEDLEGNTPSKDPVMLLSCRSRILNAALNGRDMCFECGWISIISEKCVGSRCNLRTGRSDKWARSSRVHVYKVMGFVACVIAEGSFRRWSGCRSAGNAQGAGRPSPHNQPQPSFRFSLPPSFF